MRNPCAVVAAGLVHDKRVPAGDMAAWKNHWTHYWALRQQARALVGGGPGCGVGGCRPAWWWGVVFDLWIVVASIMPARVSSSGGAGVG